MTVLRSTTCLAIVSLSALVVASPLVAGIPAGLVEFLEGHVDLDAKHISTIESGEVFVKVLDTAHDRDIAVFGAVAIGTSPAQYADHHRDIELRLREASTVRLVIFSDPAVPEDVEDLEWDPQEIADLKDCEPGNCKIKMPASGMERAQRDFDWSAPDLEDQLNRSLRERTIEFVTDYRARGDAAMLVYDDKESVRASDAFDSLMEETSYDGEDIPLLYEYLRQYPAASLDGARDVMFWSIDEGEGLKPTVSVSHAVAYSPPAHPNAVVTATKQLYASHYFEASFDVMLAVADDTSAQPRVYHLVLKRARFDSLPRIPFVNTRSRVENAMGGQLRTELAEVKAALE